MNAIILSAIWGVIMMFCGVFIKSKTTPKYIAIFGLVSILISSIFEYLNHKSFFNIQINDMLRMDNFNLAFIALILLCTLIYFLLNGAEIEKVGEHVGEYYALIFFILSPMAIS